MPRPGAYLTDVTEGITRVEDVPKANIISRSRNSTDRTCPRCGTRASRLRCVQRLLHDLGALVSGHPHDIPSTSSQPPCSHCTHSCNAAMADVALPGSHDPPRVVAVAGRVVVEDGWPYRAASWHRWRDHRVCVPCATRHHGVEARGKQSRGAAHQGRSRLGTR